jgi:hypothetical protein
MTGDLWQSDVLKKAAGFCSQTGLVPALCGVYANLSLALK